MRLFFGILVTIIILGACSSNEATNYEVGSNFLDADAAIRVIDTFTVNTSTFKLDELVTSSTGRILLGHIKDDVFGNTSSTSYFQLSTSNFTIDDDAIYDSIGFVMNYDKYYIGDTLRNQTYKLYRVTETFEPDEDNGEDNFYNYTTLDFDDDDALGTLTFKPRPFRGDSLYMPVNYDLGEEIFNKIKDDEISSSDDFIQEYKGFVIVPDILSLQSPNNTSNILGFTTSATENLSTNTSLRVYYSLEDGDNDDDINYIDIVVTSSSNLFNHITSDLAENSSYKDSEEFISSSETNDEFYIQGGTGISAKVSIPGLKRLSESYEYGTSLDAELTFKPVTRTPENELQDSLLVYVIDKNNNIQNQLFDIDGSASYAILNEDQDGNDDYFYSVNMTGFVEQILNSDFDLDYHLMFQVIDFDDTTETTILQAPNNNSDRAKLSVKYLNY